MHYRRFREVAACVPQPSLLLTVYQPLPGCGIRQLFLHHAGHCGRCYRCPKWVNQRLPQLTAFCWTCKEWVHWLPSTFQFSLPGDWCDHGLGHTFLACTGAFDPWETTWCDCVSTKLPLCRWVHWRKKSSSCRVQMYTENFRCVFFFSLRCECGDLHGHTAGGQWLAASCSLHWLQGGRLWKWCCYHCAEMRMCH